MDLSPDEIPTVKFSLLLQQRPRKEKKGKKKENRKKRRVKKRGPAVHAHTLSLKLDKNVLVLFLRARITSG